MKKNNKTSTKNKFEILLWSIALPGFGQLLNRAYLKGIILIALEVIVNVKGNLNYVIVLSFHGRIQEAIGQTDYLWYMFYPCLYFFAIWDAYKDAGGGEGALAFLPLVVTTYFVTISVALSPIINVFGYYIGPVWLPIISIPIGLLLGEIIRKILLRNRD